VGKPTLLARIKNKIARIAGGEHLSTSQAREPEITCYSREQAFFYVAIAAKAKRGGIIPPYQ
jgi:hypothetical protein